MYLYTIKLRSKVKFITAQKRSLFKITIVINKACMSYVFCCGSMVDASFQSIVHSHLTTQISLNFNVLFFNDYKNKVIIKNIKNI